MIEKFIEYKFEPHLRFEYFSKNFILEPIFLIVTSDVQILHKLLLYSVLKGPRYETNAVAIRQSPGKASNWKLRSSILVSHLCLSPDKQSTSIAALSSFNFSNFSYNRFMDIHILIFNVFVTNCYYQINQILFLLHLYVVSGLQLFQLLAQFLQLFLGLGQCSLFLSQGLESRIQYSPLRTNNPGDGIQKRLDNSSEKKFQAIFENV